jgi:hypothetical protein
MSYNYNEEQRRLETQNIALRYEVERERSNSFWNLLMVMMMMLLTGHHGGSS